MKLYVGNLPWSVDDNALKELFASYSVEEATVIKDKYSGRSKGFGFVTIADDATANKAISEMHEKEIEGRALTVSEARPMVSRDSGSRYNDSHDSEPSEAPMADPSAINEDSNDAEPEVVDDNSDAEKGEEKIESVDEAKEDAESDAE